MIIPVVSERLVAVATLEAISIPLMNLFMPPQVFGRSESKATQLADKGFPGVKSLVCLHRGQCAEDLGAVRARKHPSLGGG